VIDTDVIFTSADGEVVEKRWEFEEERAAHRMDSG
jgi:hypothetical protein